MSQSISHTQMFKVQQIVSLTWVQYFVFQAIAKIRSVHGTVYFLLAFEMIGGDHLTIASSTHSLRLPSDG